MTVIDQEPAPSSTTTGNPHRIPALISGWAIPFVFIGALWGAGHNPQHAGVSAFAVFAIIVIHLVQRIRRAAWNRWYRTA